MNISSISFGKTFISKLPVRNLNTGEKEPLDFVQYDTTEDIKHVQKAAKKWASPIIINGTYAENVVHDMERTIANNNQNYRYFGIEDNNSSIQALCEVRLDDPNWIDSIEEREENINYIIVNPKHMHGSKTRQYSKLGSILFREIIKFAKRDGIKNITLSDSSDGFWENMPYVENTNQYLQSRALKGENYDKCLKRLDEII